MEGDVAAALDLDELDPAALQLGVGDEQAGAAGVAAEGDYRRVLEQDQGVGDLVREAELDETVLEVEGGTVRDAAEADKQKG